MPNNDYYGMRVKLTAETAGFITGMQKATHSQEQFANATRAANKGTKRSSLAFVEVARGLEDAQYGFRGVQNNINQLAFTMGLGGPLILAITAAGLAIQYLIDNWDDLGFATDEVNEATKDLTESYEMLIKRISDNNAPVKKLEDDFQDLIDKFKEMDANIGTSGIDRDSPYYKAWIDLKHQIEAATGAVIDFSDPKYLQKLEALRGPIKKLAKDIDDFNTATRVGEISGKFSPTEIAKRNLESFINTQKALAVKEADYLASGDYQVLVAKVARAEVKALEKARREAAKTTNKSRAKVSTLDVAVQSTTQDQTAVWQKQARRGVEAFREAWGLEASKIDLTLPKIDVTKELEKLKKPLEEGANEIGQALQSALTGAFQGLGQSIGDALSGDGDFGDKFLGILGSFMQAFGTAIIGVGVAALTLETSLLAGQPWLAIGAGVALVAAGAYLSSISSKGVDGEGGGPANPGSNLSGATTPSSVQGAGFNQGELVATVRGQDLRFVLQAADDSYSGLN